jgi:hypothetical protein
MQDLSRPLSAAREIALYHAIAKSLETQANSTTQTVAYITYISIAANLIRTDCLTDKIVENLIGRFDWIS